MSAPDILPLCTTRETRGRVLIDGRWCVPCYCMSCHQHKGFADDPGDRPGYVGYLCDDCAPKWGEQVGLSLTPCMARALEANAAMLNDYGRVLGIAEQALELDDVNSVLSRFARSLA